MRRLKIPDDVAALIRGLHPDLKRRVRAALAAIADDPGVGKPLREELGGLRTLRVSRIRVVYRTAGRVIEVVAVGPRRTVYEESWRRMRRTPPSS